MTCDAAKCVNMTLGTGANDQRNIGIIILQYLILCLHKYLPSTRLLSITIY